MKEQELKWPGKDASDEELREWQRLYKREYRKRKKEEKKIEAAMQERQKREEQKARLMIATAFATVHDTLQDYGRNPTEEKWLKVEVAQDALHDYVLNLLSRVEFEIEED